MAETPQLFGKPSAEYQALLTIGGITLAIAGARKADIVFDVEHEPFRTGTGPAHIHLDVGWVRKLEPVPSRPLFDSGTTWSLYRSDHGFRFDLGDRIGSGHIHKRLFVDEAFGDATLQISTEYFSPFPHAAAPLAYPLDELLIMHRLTQEKAIELHGCGIVRADGIGNLFVGHSGAGKSTTTRLWTEREDVEVLSDDRIIVRRHEQQQVPPLRFAKSRNDRFAAGVSVQNNNAKSKMRMYGTPWHGEAMYASPNSASLARIFILEHGHGNVLKPLSPSQAVAELFARSFVPFHRHEYVESALEFLQEVADAVPVYRYAFEPDQRAVDTILDFRD
jgi:hypothetical protein